MGTLSTRVGRLELAMCPQKPAQSQPVSEEEIQRQVDAIIAAGQGQHVLAELSAELGTYTRRGGSPWGR